MVGLRETKQTTSWTKLTEGLPSVMSQPREESMKLSIHKHIRGKPRKDQGYNLGYDWITIDVSWDDAFRLITEDGCAVSAELTSDNRKEANFASRQLIMVDIDNGMSIEELLNDDFYNAYGAGFYATPSFTPELHKFRIMFMLEQAETDPIRLRKLNRGLLQVFAQADEACKDPTRIFYGTPNCVLAEQTQKLLPDDIAQALVDMVNEQDQARLEAMANQPVIDHTMSDQRRAKILELLRSCFVGDYHIWRNIGWGLKAGGFALQDYQHVTQGMMRAKTAQDAATVWNDGTVGGAVTMGTVIHFLRERLGEDCLKETTPVVVYYDLEKKMKEKYGV